MNSTISCEQSAVLVNIVRARTRNFANGGVKFVSQTYDMRCCKLSLETPGIIHLCKGF